jgi:hypothetical protein
MTHVNDGPFTTCFTVADDVLVFCDDEVCLRVLARPAENELIDEVIEELTQFGSIMSAVYDVSIVFFIERGLSTQFASEKLGRVGRRPAEGTGDVGHIWNNGFDTITLAFNLCEKDGHPMKVSNVA